MSKQKLTVLQVIPRSGIARATQRPWEIFAAQCILEQESDEGKQLLVGTINLPKDLKDTIPGDYIAEFAFYQSMDGKLETRVVSLLPLNAPKVRPAAGVSVPA